MTKYASKSKSKGEDRLIKVNIENEFLSWDSKKKSINKSNLELLTVKELRLGQNTKIFELHGKKEDLESRSFSIIYVKSGQYKSLNLGNWNLTDSLDMNF